MLINFTKMHGLGNDFVVIDMLTQYAKLQSVHFKKIADRRFGIGCDQVLLIESPRDPQSDLFFRIFNADGYEAEQCGNGARCVARFAYDTNLIYKKNMVIDCLAGRLNISLEEENDHITVDMGKLLPNPPEQKTLSVGNKQYTAYYTTLGNPHAVVPVADLEKTNLPNVGAKISTHSVFDTPVNVSFMQIIDETNIALRVYERGVGLTPACGSAAIAAVGCGHALGKLTDKVQVHFQYGSLWVNKKNTHHFTLTGPATRLFVGRFRI